MVHFKKQPKPPTIELETVLIETEQLKSLTPYSKDPKKQTSRMRENRQGGQSGFVNDFAFRKKSFCEADIVGKYMYFNPFFPFPTSLTFRNFLLSNVTNL